MVFVNQHCQRVSREEGGQFHLRIRRKHADIAASRHIGDVHGKELHVGRSRRVTRNAGVRRQGDDNFQRWVGEVFGSDPIANLKAIAGCQRKVIDRFLIKVGSSLIHVWGEDEKRQRRG